MADALWRRLWLHASYWTFSCAARYGSAGITSAFTMIKDWPQVFARVRAALMRRGRCAQDADDFVQEAWLRLASYESSQPVAQPEAFLMRAALNLSIDAHRSSAAHGDQVMLDEVVLLDAAPGTEAVVLARERMVRLSHCISRLSPKSREILLLHRIDGLTYQEIAREHGLSISTVEKHVAKATLMLTTWMEGW